MQNIGSIILKYYSNCDHMSHAMCSAEKWWWCNVVYSTSALI